VSSPARRAEKSLKATSTKLNISIYPVWHELKHQTRAWFQAKLVLIGRF